MWIKPRWPLALGLLLWSIGLPLWAAVLTDIAVRDGSGGSNQVTLSFSGKPTYGYFSLSGPDRLVLDLRNTRKEMSLPKRYRGKLVETIRTSTPPQGGTLRLVMELSQRVNAKAVTESRGGNKYQVVLTIKPQSGSSRSSATTNSRQELRSTPGRSSERIVIAIDPGHGGQDPGAIGKNGLREKQVTIAIATKLRDLLNRDGNFKAVMTRERDYFISVGGRSEIARGKDAQLLVSIHADAAPNRSAKGASVWVLSNRRANSEMGRWLEDHEKQSELLGGAGEVLSGNNNDRYLSQTVLDLQFGHSQRVGYDVASRVLREMGRISPLHKRRPEHASLGVLRSPDIPSLLVETGFISNPTEERLLGSSSHQTKVATAIYHGIRSYYRDHPAARSTPAPQPPVRSSSVSQPEPVRSSASSSVSSKAPVVDIDQPGPIVEKVPVKTSSSAAKAQVHVVKRGETLTRIAEQYDTDVATLKRLNRMKSGELLVGQRLKLPSAASSSSAEVTESRPRPPVVDQPEPVVDSRAAASATTVHTVTRGETLLRIAEKYDTTLAELRSLNNLKRDQVNVGQKLKVPSGKTASAPVSSKSAADSSKAPSRGKLEVYQVQRGDTLGKIAARYAVSMETIKFANQMHNNQVQVGQKLKIPLDGAAPKESDQDHSKAGSKSKESARPSHHKVKAGETLSGIADRYGVGLSQLRKYNHLKSDQVNVGQSLKIPQE
ncbi:LysM peptidoglycan-binding domain-containing protein [Plesiomonas shigelloides]|uniref:LysM peptidoglycan-binding domain-containing protein n=1 Tax=Plesiomonas shigelloides TaxID=703 RepID=UPI00068ABCB4|nr:LysM peptidoglycan-binding domain-containing protein [Plesiomonas shigelloides]